MVLLSIAVIISFVIPKQNSRQNVQWIPFKWNGGTYGGKYYDKVAMYIPVTIDNLPDKLNMHLDLGAPQTLIWGNPIKPYLEKYAQLLHKIDTSETAPPFWMNNKKYTSDLRDIDFKLGDVPFGKRDICYYKDFGSAISKDSISNGTAVTIGNIGGDIFQDKVLIIDYPNDRIGIADEIPKQYSKASFMPFTLVQGNIIIPLIINDKKEELIYDCGTLIHLVTSEKNALQISGNTIVDSFEGSNWGRKYMGYDRKINVSVLFGNKQLKPGGMVSYSNLGIFDDFFINRHIWGIAGNNFFLDNVIIIDYKDHTFGIM